MQSTIGPVELRVTWEPDPEPYDPGDFNDAETWRYVELWGVHGCTVEIRRPACACCGVKAWEHAASLWGIVGGDAYHREIERDLMYEAGVLAATGDLPRV